MKELESAMKAWQMVQLGDQGRTEGGISNTQSDCHNYDGGPLLILISFLYKQAKAVVERHKSICYYLFTITA